MTLISGGYLLQARFGREVRAFTVERAHLSTDLHETFAMEYLSAVRCNCRESGVLNKRYVQIARAGGGIVHACPKLLYLVKVAFERQNGKKWK